jgi:hypothetical protein
MKKMKKVFVILLAMVMVFSLAACKAGVPNYELQIDPATGEGTANFTIRVPKNDAPEVGNNFDKEEEKGYIKSADALLTLFQDAVPSGFDVTMKDEENIVTNDDGNDVDQGNFAYTLTFTFKGIDDYNKKIMDLVGQSSWDGANDAAKAVADTAGSSFTKIVPATMTSEPNGDKSTVTFSEDLRILDVIGYWAYSVLTSDKTGVWNDLFKDTYKDYPVNFGNTINLDLAKYSVKFGDETQEYRHSADPVVTLQATVDAVVVAAPADDSSSDDSNADSTTTEVPKTGNNSYLGGIFAAAAALMLVSFVAIQRKTKKA